jgi:hypothetical protein
MMLGLLDHLVRKSAATGFAHIGAEFGHYRADRVSGKHSSGKRRCRGDPTGALQKTAPAHAAVGRLVARVSMMSHIFSPKFLLYFTSGMDEAAPRHPRCPAKPRIPQKNSLPIHAMLGLISACPKSVPREECSGKPPAHPMPEE